ncbi:hypothetical protein NPX13_g3647 [Xylaria arbuscula]|uniref:Uncharacterized protein n=1 Tax=Xylaria arbuscula TaxID=114810 RepID=A0A9W8TMM3_9PEZI|nr:hypothetical protein NPX13_g3647 [Xylaria arbuscula]
MDKGFAPLVELAANMGMRNARGGLHYNKTIAAAKSMKLERTSNILTEHRMLCADSEPVADAPAMFSSVEDLVDWVRGDWTGAYLYEGGGDRKDLTGRKTMMLKAFRARDNGADGEGWDADVEGTSGDDMGKWVVKGKAWVSGKIVFRIFHEEGSEEQGWEYTGFASPVRRACGGYWGIRNAERETSGGTFLFYRFG